MPPNSPNPDDNMAWHEDQGFTDPLDNLEERMPNFTGLHNYRSMASDAAKEKCGKSRSEFRGHDNYWVRDDELDTKSRYMDYTSSFYDPDPPFVLGPAPRSRALQAELKEKKVKSLAGFKDELDYNRKVRRERRDNNAYSESADNERHERATRNEKMLEAARKRNELVTKADQRADQRAREMEKANAQLRKERDDLCRENREQRKEAIKAREEKEKKDSKLREEIEAQVRKEMEAKYQEKMRAYSKAEKAKADAKAQADAKARNEEKANATAQNDHDPEPEFAAVNARICRLLEAKERLKNIRIANAQKEDVKAEEKGDDKVSEVAGVEEVKKDDTVKVWIPASLFDRAAHGESVMVMHDGAWDKDFKDDKKSENVQQAGNQDWIVVSDDGKDKDYEQWEDLNNNHDKTPMPKATPPASEPGYVTDFLMPGNFPNSN